MTEHVHSGFQEPTSQRRHSTADSVYKIGDLAREFDVTLRTLRFYEDRGLINPARSGTTRLYSAQDRERLRIALFCKRIGLSLGEVHDVLTLFDESSENPSALEKIRDIYQGQLGVLEKLQSETTNTISDLRLKLNEFDS